MKIKAFGAFLALMICLLTVSVSFAAASDIARQTSATALQDEGTSLRSVKSEMKVCVERMNYYKNANFDGSPLGTKKFGDIVYGENVGEGVMCIYNKSGDMLGYCDVSSLVGKDARFFAELPQETNDAGQISKLVDLRKYILIFDAKVNCDADEPILIQYDTAMKLFGAATEINKEYDCVINVDKAYLPSSSSSSCCEKDHSTGSVLTLSITRRGESASEKIPVYESDQTVGKISKILSDYSLIRDAELDCFYDADINSYISTDYNMSSLIYSVWE